MKRKGVWWLLEMNVDMRKEKNQSTLEEEAETLVSIFLPAERTYLATIPQLTPEVVEELLEHFMDPVNDSNAKGRKTIGMGCLHVDDLFITGTPEFLEKFKKKVWANFKIGHEDVNDLMFTGQRVKWQLDEKTKKKSHIVVEQSLCVSELTEIVITKGQKDEEKCDKDMDTAYRSLLGSINWLQSRTQFQACYHFFSFRCASAAASPTIGDCKALNKLCKQIVNDPMELKFWPLEGQPRLMAMPDAAFRNNSDKSSQRAMVIFMSEPRKEKSRNSRGSLIFFESTKIKRTTLSTTVAELYALMKCYGTCQMLRGLIKDITGHSCEIHMRTDANNVVTTASTTHVPEQQETIHMIQMLRKEACSGSNADLSHIRTQWCLADCLTKKSANPQALIDAVRQGVLKEVDAHPPFRTLVEHKAYLRSWLPTTVCHHVNFALDVFFLAERFHWQMCAENLLHVCLFHVVWWRLPCFACMSCWKKFSFLFMNLCLRLKIFSFRHPTSCCWYSLLLLVVYLLSSEMATRVIDFLKNSIEHKECEQSTWRLEQVVFARSERKCVTLHPRESDHNIEDTKYAIENVLALMCSERMSTKFSLRRNWEVDFVRSLLGYTTFDEEQSFNTLTLDHYKMCSDERSITKKIGKAMTAVLRHGTKWNNIADKKGAIPMVSLLDALHHSSNPLTHHAAGRIFAAMINGNDKQRFFIDVYMYDTWFPEEFSMPWDLYIGCHQGHSNMTVTPSEINHRLTEVECYSMGWIFHVTDKKFQNAIFADGLRRRGRNAMHFMYENDGKSGYVIKGVGTRKPREYDTTIYCVLNVKQLLKDGFDLFLSANGVVLIYDDVSLGYFHMVEKYPYLGLCVFSPGVPHSLPREVQSGKWRDSMTLRRKYEEYLSPDEISKYLDAKGDLVEWHMPRNIGSKRRQTAWEFMNQAPPAAYIECISSLFKERQVKTSSGSAPAEGFDVKATAEASSSSATVEEFDVEAELSTMNSQEIQAVRIISENAWHLWQAGVLSLRTSDGQKVENMHYEVVTVLREFWRMSESQQKTLLSEGVSRHVWERYPLAGHSVFFMTRAWEIGRMTAYVKNYSGIEEKEAFQKERKRNT